MSTDPSNWTGLNYDDAEKLELKPVDENEYRIKRAANRLDPNAIYYGTVHKTLLSDARFFVHCVGIRPLSEISYYVLARPENETAVYYRDAREE